MQAVPLEEIGAEVDVLGFWVPRVLDAGVQRRGLGQLQALPWAGLLGKLEEEGAVALRPASVPLAA